MPQRIVSDRGPQFSGPYAKAMNRALGVDLMLSTAYHPQSDGQTERTNEDIEIFLRIFCNHRQDDWDEYLAFAEFAHNNTIHSSIGVSPFFANKGYNPTFTNSPSEAQGNPAAKDRLEVIALVQQEIKSAMAIAQEHQKRYYDQRRKETKEYKVGDQVMLETTNLNIQRPSKKLAPRRLGPFPIEAKISSHAYRLTLPPTMNVHKVFHTTLLTPFKEDTIPGRKQTPPEPEVIDDELEYEVEQIVDSKWDRKQFYYIVKWKGYGDDDNTEEPPEGLEHAQRLVQEFHERFPEAPHPNKAPPTKRKRRG